MTVFSKATKVYYNDCEDYFIESYKIINILNLVTNRYELLHIDQNLFNNKLNEFRLERHEFITPSKKGLNPSYISNDCFRETVIYFYKAHTGLNLEINLSDYMRQKKLDSRKGVNSFFNIYTHIDIIERPYFYKRLNITNAIKLFLDVRCPVIGQEIVKSVYLWSSNSPYKGEQRIYDEIRKIFGFNNKLSFASFSQYNFDIERLSQFYINQINKL